MKLKRTLPDKYKYWPKYCELDGKELLNSESFLGYFFDTLTGKHMKRFKHFRYCPDWKESRSAHTEYWGREEICEDESND